MSEGTTRCGDENCGDLSKYPVLQTWLPPGYDYHVISFEEQTADMDHSAFCATLRLPFNTEERITQWVLETKNTPATWRVKASRPMNGTTNIFRRDYKCQHNVHKGSATAGTKRTKNTNCPAKLSVILKADPRREGRVSRAKVDPHLPQYPTVVILQNVHNHNVHSAAALKHRDVGSEATEKLTKLFEIGHSVPSAVSALQHDLRAEHGGEYVYAAADRAICPDRGFAKRLYKKVKSSTTSGQSCSQSVDMVSVSGAEGAVPRKFLMALKADQTGECFNQPLQPSHHEQSTPLASAPSASHQDYSTLLASIPCASEGNARTTEECETGSSADHPVLHDKEDSPERRILMKRMRNILTTVANTLENDPTISDDTITTLTKRFADICNPSTRNSAIHSLCGYTNTTRP